MPQLTTAMGPSRTAALVGLFSFLVFPSIAHSQTYEVLRVRGSPDLEGQIGGWLLEDLNNGLAGVGVAFDQRTFRNVAFYWTPAGGARLMRFIADPQSLVINNRGEIAGIRRVNGNPNK